MRAGTAERASMSLKTFWDMFGSARFCKIPRETQLISGSINKARVLQVPHRKLSDTAAGKGQG